MIREKATVVAIEGDSITVEAAIKSTCNSCQAQSDCGTGLVSRALAPRTQQLTLRSPMSVKLGQEVTVGIPEAGILSASAWLYLMPLTSFILAFILASLYLPTLGLTQELWALLPSVTITFLVYKVISRKLQVTESGKYQPVLLESLE
ncbi:SoxR reducing system RseC family protein [Alteromonas gracilis]|uniref:SoxR reducing system RseC family protein n=1 Tax=Alteromonas gracilis TaxID=1479524 RepID=UPI0030D28711